MAERIEASRAWDASWEASRQQFLESVMRATPAQRLAWLEEALELAYRAGALDARVKP